MSFTKKQQIIKAFENLDADALSNLLDDEKTYQDVPKSLFVGRYREYFDGLKEDASVICDFKAYPGKCEGCSKGKTGYSFVNSEGTCFGEFVFVEDEEDFSDIYVCHDFNSSNEDILDNFNGLTFCDDEKVGYMLTFDELVEKDFCLRALNEIQTELQKNKILPLEFIKEWHKKYNPHYGDLKIFGSKHYSFTLLITNYLGNIRNALSFIELSNKSALYLEMFKDKVFADDEAKMMWMMACMEDIPDINLYLHAKVNEEENYISFGRINIDLKYMANYIKLQKLFQQNSDLLPYSILMSLPWDWKTPSEMTDTENDCEWDDDDEFPF